MATAQFASINPHVLAWARAESGWPREQVAQRLNIKLERLEEWESGARKPTVRQAQGLARFLHRPLSIFFLPSPPDLPALAAEYRRLAGVQVGAESPQLRLALRQMLNRRDYAQNLLDELGETVSAFGLAAHLTETPAEVGARLRALLGITTDAQFGWSSEWQAWRTWRAAVEKSGVLVFQFSKVALEEVRGLTLIHTALPVIGINGKERVPEAKTFTLLHELVHLMLAAGHEEAPALQEKRSNEQWSEVERFAESAASHALVAQDDLKQAAVGYATNAGAWSVQDVRRMARRFWITPLAMATRLREAGFMNWNRYNEWRAKWSAYLAALPVRGGGFASPAEKAVNRHGRPFVQLVLEAMAGNRISSVDAARYLDLKFQHFDQLRELLIGPGTGASTDG